MSLRPVRLHKGDTIGIIAPAGPPKVNQLKNGISYLQSLGLNVKIGKHVFDTYGYLAGTDEDRLHDLHEMFADHHIKGIICARGGYGTARIASQINFELIANNPKIFWGYSDITFLHTAIREKTGLVTFHGPMVSSDIGEPDFDTLSKHMFNQLFKPSQLIYTEQISLLQVINEGEAVGELVGGNLSLLINTLGTEFEIDTRNKLLVIEDIGEETYRIDAFLNQLKMAGKLKDVSGVVVGDFGDTEVNKETNLLSLDEVLTHYLAAKDKPVIKGFKIGHCLPNFSIPFGVEAKLSSKDKTLHISPGVC
ncbi:S66 peptidase family protein [Aquibacillus rhizosphaerae]|uniref:LD-carboxypeptidase n=1 Tax=Aquibacillus rhizosphaerae TaxID=3051431 RepID=A0ABT7L0L5_9BACI|nr:LD-carboxypeptidase [Aquibacillus sp. LR5S19]MDL4838864.1 LD-carboxypeptidase [Aquibacillus sp. LR5S19]